MQIEINEKEIIYSSIDPISIICKCNLKPQSNTYAYTNVEILKHSDEHFSSGVKFSLTSIC